MTQTQHTPGPFVTDGGTHVQALFTPSDGGKPFYHTVARTDQILVRPEQQAANSHLFAAAPELLAVATLIDRSWSGAFPGGPDTPPHGGCHFTDETKDIWRQMRAVISKAKGLAA